jgi:DNA-binding response OmpR family regulator
MQDFIRYTLECNFKNIEVVIVSNGVKAIKEIEKSPYDIILCDWNVPLLSGDKLLQWIRETPSFKDTTFIMITGRTSEADVLRAKELGVNDYIVKPVNTDVLINKLSRNIDTLIRI